MLAFFALQSSIQNTTQTTCQHVHTHFIAPSRIVAVVIAVITLLFEIGFPRNLLVETFIFMYFWMTLNFDCLHFIYSPYHLSSPIEISLVWWTWMSKFTRSLALFSPPTTTHKEIQITVTYWYTKKVTHTAHAHCCTQYLSCDQEKRQTTVTNP